MEKPRTLLDACEAMPRDRWRAMARELWRCRTEEYQDALMLEAVQDRIEETAKSVAGPGWVDHWVDPEGRYRIRVYD